MGESVRAELTVAPAGDCPVARASAETDGTVEQVARSTTADRTGDVREEFVLAGHEDLELTGVDTVFDADGQTVYRFDRDWAEPCVCACIEAFGCPISRLHAVDGRLAVSFYADDIEQVQEIVGGLDKRFDDVAVRQLATTADRSASDFVFVDRNRLTRRQREVLETCFELGYFEYPKGASAAEVAAELDIATSTFSEHLAAAQRNLLESLLDA